MLTPFLFYNWLVSIFWLSDTVNDPVLLHFPGVLQCLLISRYTLDRDCVFSIISNRLFETIIVTIYS